MPIKAIVTDIEGTTTSISFVYDCLFPYARQRLNEFLQQHASESAVAKQMAIVADEASVDANAEAVAAVLLQWMDEDKKAGPLKAIQGMIWQAGYADGSLKGHVYLDAVKNLRNWHDAKIALYVYSSGSVQAQQLIFGYSEHGDLTALFSGYFDTAIGPKRSVESYRAIQAKIRYKPGEILFLSDIVAELDAAAEAGLQTVLVERNPKAESAESQSHPRVSTFDEIGN